jgi:phage baseplate assembly protein W
VRAVAAHDFVGRGWSFPPRLGPSGGVRLVGGGEEVDGAIRMILSTRPGERLMRPDFGCEIWELLFAPLDATTLGAAAAYVHEALGRWEPRIDVEDVHVTPDPARAVLEIAVTYRIRATNDVRNLVHPFYTIPSEEVAP